MTSPTCIDSIASIAGRPKRLGTYRTGRPRSAAIRSACTSRAVKSSLPGRDWWASNATFAPLSSRIVSRCSRILASFRSSPVAGSIGELMSTRRRTVRPERSKSSIVKKSRAIGIRRKIPEHNSPFASRVRGGNPEASLYHRDGAQDRGRSALKKVWQDSYDESCILELHARVDMDGLVREYADSILERPAKVVKKTKIPQTMERSEIEKQIRAWKDKGYDVSSVESNLDAEPSILAASVVAMRDGVKKAEAVGEMLAGLDVSGFESRAAILRERLKDPVRHPDIDTEVESLRDAVESLRQIEARRQVELERGRDSQERTRKVLDLVMKQQQALRPEAGPYSTEDVARKVLEETQPARDAATNLVQTYTFESFIVGASNRFAHGAAVAVAKQPAKEHNPLLITSGPGLGKTHLLHAIGNYVASRIGARRRPRASGPPDAGDHPRASRPRRERRHRGRSADVHREPRGEQRPRARWGLQSGRRVLVVDASPAHPGSRPRSLVRCDRGTDRGTDPATDARADRGRAGRPSAELGDGNPRTY